MRVFDIEKDGLPDMDKLVGRVAFIFDGCIVSGWPLYRLGDNYPGQPMYGADVWEADSDVGRAVRFEGIKKYVVFDVPVWDL